MTEFGADTIPGFHHEPPIIFSEEYQYERMKRHAEVFDSRPFVIGEHVWVMFDFATKQELRRVDGNRKGLFTRTRQPKAAAHFMRARWAKMKGAPGARGRVAGRRGTALITGAPRRR